MLTIESKNTLKMTTAKKGFKLSGLKSGNGGLGLKKDVLEDDVDNDDVVCENIEKSDKSTATTTSRRKRKKNRAKKSRRNASGCVETQIKPNPPIIKRLAVAPSISEPTCVRPMIFDRSKKPVINGVKSESYLSILSPHHVTSTRENGGVQLRRLSGGRHVNDVRKPDDTEETMRRSEELFRRLLALMQRRERCQSPDAQALLRELSTRIQRLRLYIDGRQAQIPSLPTFTLSVESESPKRTDGCVRRVSLRGEIRNVDVVPRPCHSVEIRDCRGQVSKHRSPSDELLVNRKHRPVIMLTAGGAMKPNDMSISRNCNSRTRNAPTGDMHHAANGAYNDRSGRASTQQNVAPRIEEINPTTPSQQGYIQIYPLICQQCLMMLPTCPHGNSYIPTGFLCPHYQYLWNHYHYMHSPTPVCQTTSPQPALAYETTVTTRPCLPAPSSKASSQGFSPSPDNVCRVVECVPPCPPSKTQVASRPRVPPCPPSTTQVAAACTSYEEPCAISVPLPRDVKPKPSDEELKKCMAETTRVALVDRICPLPCGYNVPLQCTTSTDKNGYTSVSSHQHHHNVERTPSGRIIMHDCECTDDAHVVPETSKTSDQNGNRRISFFDHGTIVTQENDHPEPVHPKLTSPPPDDIKDVNQDKPQE